MGVIRLRFPASCSKCGVSIPPRTRAHWDTETRSAICLGCMDRCGSPGPSKKAAEIGSTQLFLPSDNTVSRGVAGGSAQREFERRHQKRLSIIDARFGRWSGIVKSLFDDPQSTKAWADGASGERILAEYLSSRLEGSVVILNDRKVPGTRGNIDHIAVASSGVWVIDTKRYRGDLKKVNRGGPFRTDYGIFINGRDRTKLIADLDWQSGAVRKALSDFSVPVHSVLCFIGVEWGLFLKPFQLDGVWVTYRKSLAEMISEEGPIKKEEITRVAARLQSRFAEK